MRESKVSEKDENMESKAAARLQKSISGNSKILLLVFAGFCAWAYQEACPPPPKTIPITTPRIKLRDGRHLSYIESGVPKESAKSKLIFVHGFLCSKYNNPFASASPAVIEELGVYIVAIDRPGYGESDPHPKRTVKSMALDIEELADQLNLGSKFYVAGYSMGGQPIWSCLKYIPHRLAGAILIAPAINYWWPGLPSTLSNEAYSQQLQQDQWAMRISYYLPSITYWWNTQKWFPRFSVIDSHPAIYSTSDVEVMTKLFASTNSIKVREPTLQGEFESLHRDLNIGFGKWDFDPMDLENPYPNKNGSVHLWMGDSDRIVSVTLQRYIAQQLPWIKYHEVVGAGHMFAFSDGMTDSMLKELLNDKN